LQRRDIGIHGIEIGRDLFDLRVKTRKLVLGDASLGLNDLRERSRIRKERRVAGARRLGIRARRFRIRGGGRRSRGRRSGSRGRRIGRRRGRRRRTPGGRRC